MEPSAASNEKKPIRLRAYGIYPKTSIFNHDCLPNALSSFNYVDSASDGNTDIIIRTIHDVPEGREVCLSYSPLKMTYSSRRKRLLEDYGFKCDCHRCKVESCVMFVDALRSMKLSEINETNLKLVLLLIQAYSNNKRLVYY